MYTSRDTIEPRLVEIADAAVMALHPVDANGDSTKAYPNGTVTSEGP
jgi:hypothetical protein